MAILTVAGVVLDRRERLRDHGWLRGWLPELTARIAMHPVGEAIIQPYGHWDGGAPSAVQFIEEPTTAFQGLKESAILVHTWPEADYIQINLDSCNPIPRWKDLVMEIIGDLQLDLKYATYDPALNWRTLSSGPSHKPHLWPPQVQRLAEAIRSNHR